MYVWSSLILIIGNQKNNDKLHIYKWQSIYVEYTADALLI